MNRSSMRPRTLFEVSRRAISGEQAFDPSLCEFLDEFYGQPYMREISMAREPLLIDDIKDAYLAAVAEYLAAVYDFDAPGWTEDHGVPLRRAFFANGGLESLKALLTVESPMAFRKRLLFVGRDALDRARRHTQPDVDGQASFAP